MDRTAADPLQSNRTAIEAQVDTWKQAERDRTGREPRNRDIIQYRQYIESQYMSLGSMIKQLVAVLRKGELQGTKADAQKAERLVKAINDREQWLMNSILQANGQATGQSV